MRREMLREKWKRIIVVEKDKMAVKFIGKFSKIWCELFP